MGRTPSLSPHPEPANTGMSGINRTFLVVVDDTEEMGAALEYACRRAKATQGRVALLRTVEPAEYRQLAFVGSMLEKAAREEAETLLHRLAARVKERSGDLPILYVREGDPKDQLMALIDQEPGISVLVLAAGSGKDGPGPLVTACATGLIAKLRVPVTIIPAGLSPEDLNRMS
ncbi:MAG: universal stress protein [Rhodospirillaceae bacterium]